MWIIWKLVVNTNRWYVCTCFFFKLYLKSCCWSRAIEVIFLVEEEAYCQPILRTVSICGHGLVFVGIECVTTTVRCVHQYKRIDTIFFLEGTFQNHVWSLDEFPKWRSFLNAQSDHSIHSEVSVEHLMKSNTTMHSPPGITHVIVTADHGALVTPSPMTAGTFSIGSQQ